MNEQTSPTVTHAQLVAVAARWLARTCSVVVTELATQGEEPDALGWHGTHSTLVECKATRSDFAADQRKGFRHTGQHASWQGVGHYRYYCAPAGLIAVEELPAQWGLLEYDAVSERICVLRKSDSFLEVNHRQEIRILLSTLRRIGKTSPIGTSIRCYTIETRNRATLGVSDADADESNPIACPP